MVGEARQLVASAGLRLRLLLRLWWLPTVGHHQHQLVQPSSLSCLCSRVPLRLQ